MPCLDFFILGGGTNFLTRGMAPITEGNDMWPGEWWAAITAFLWGPRSAPCQNILWHSSFWIWPSNHYWSWLSQLILPTWMVFENPKYLITIQIWAAKLILGTDYEKPMFALLEVDWAGSTWMGLLALEPHSWSYPKSKPMWDWWCLINRNVSPIYLVESEYH